MTEESVKQVQTLSSAERISSGALKPAETTKISPKKETAATLSSVLAPPPIKKVRILKKIKATIPAIMKIFSNPICQRQQSFNRRRW